jgi:hypothetical protein
MLFFDDNHPAPLMTASARYRDKNGSPYPAWI